MEGLYVPTATFVTTGIALVAGILIPLLVFIFFQKKHGDKKIPFFIGFVVFIIFALVLEGAINKIIFSGDRADSIMKKPILYALIGGLMAGLFEETGRFVAFKTVLKKYRPDDHTALAYGIGHGGFEVFFLLLSTMLSDIIIAAMINSGNIEALVGKLDDSSRLSMMQTLVALCSTNPAIYLLSVLERIAAFAFHISASVLVWFAVKNKKHWILYPLAIMLHIIFNTISVAASLLGVHIVIVEIIICAFSGLSVLLGRFIWKKERAFGENYKIKLESS